MKLKSPEEEEAFLIVREIVKPVIDMKRISLSGSKTYLGIVLDNNSHRTICRVYLTPKGKFLGTISERKVETKNKISCIGDISKFSSQLIATARCYYR